MSSDPNPNFFPRIYIGAFTSLNHSALVPYARNVVLKTSAVPQYYPTPDPTLAAMTTQIDVLEKAGLDAMDGGKLLIAIRNVESAKLVTMMRRLANYVQTNCQADYVILISSGFDAVRRPSPVGQLPAPVNVSLAPTGTSGELLFRSDRLANSVALTVEYGTSPNGPFTALPPSTTSRVLVPGLTPGTVYYARACGNGSYGPGLYCVPTSAMAV